MAMMNRFRNVVSNVMGSIAMVPQIPEQTERDGQAAGITLRARFAYGRPDFLRLTGEEVQVSADPILRPILVPRDITRLPWNAGYAE